MPTLRRLLWILPLLFFVSATLGGQRPNAPDPTKVTVRLSRAAGPPDGRVSLPLTVTAAQAGAKIGTLQLDVTIPKAMLTFTGAETAGLADGVGAVVKTEIKADDKDPAFTHVLITLSTMDSTKQPFPDGGLAYLLFQISKDATLKTLIPVAMTAKATGVDAPAKAFDDMVVQGNAVEVSEAAVISCFFYMH